MLKINNMKINNEYLHGYYVFVVGKHYFVRCLFHITVPSLSYQKNI